MTYEELKQRANLNTRRPQRDEEHQTQCACVMWLRLQYPYLSPLLFAIPNGGRRDKTTAAKLKAEGVVAGVADLILLKPNAQHHALCIEMKTAKGRQSDSQKAWQEAVSRYGYLYVVVRSVDEFRMIIKNYLNDKI